MHWSGDGSQFGGDDDFFLDFSIPWNAFFSLTGVDGSSTPYRIQIASAQQGGQLADSGTGNSMTVPFSDFESLSAYSMAIPEPAVSVLIPASGISMVLDRRLFARA